MQQLQQSQRLELDKIDWHTILPRLGVGQELIERPNKLGPCPIEREGKTRFRFDNKGGRGTWICNHCGAGDGVRLVALVNGTSDAEAIGLIRESMGGMVREGYSPMRSGPAPAEGRTPAQIEKATRSIERAMAFSYRIASTPALQYLQNRIDGLRADWLNVKDFRFHPNLYHFDEETAKQSRRLALLALVRNPRQSQEVVSIHRYYINEHGHKASVSPTQVKKMMPATVEKIQGESIKTNTAPDGPVVIVAEGLENALAWVMATKNRIPVYSAMNCGNLSHFIWPKGTEALLIAGDHDPVNPKTGLRAGVHHSLLLKERAQAAGIKAVVRVPPQEGIDWDDLWNAQSFPDVSWLFQPAQEAIA